MKVTRRSPAPARPVPELHGGLHAGALVNSAAAEALTSVLIFLNGRYRVSASGIRFTGLPDDAA